MPHRPVWFISTIASSVSIALSVSGGDAFNDALRRNEKIKPSM
jgi:hypothetical protein